MASSLRYWLRLAVTWSGYFLFSVGGLVLVVFVFLPLRVLPIGRELRTRWVRQVVRGSFRLFVWYLERAGLVQVKVLGGERLRDCRGMLVLANHPTLIDIVILLSRLPPACCIVKYGLWRNPFLAGVVSAAGYVRNDSAERFVANCTESLADGQPLVIFPEGTRSTPGAPLRFRRGASYVALRSGWPILPVLIRCQPPALGKGQRWFEIPQVAVQIRIVVNAPLDCADLADVSQPPGIAARRLTAALESYFGRELASHG